MRLLAGLVLLMSVTGCSVFGYTGVEEAPYQSLKLDNDFEVRQYQKMILITAEMQDEEKSPFMQLFDYISGDNEQSQEIAMTAPVFMDKTGEKPFMSFVMPADFDMENTPIPLNSALDIEEISNLIVATIQFSGTLNPEKIAEQKTKLEAWMAAENLSPIGEAIVAGYHPPFTIPALRKNEVLIPVK